MLQLRRMVISGTIVLALTTSTALGTSASEIGNEGRPGDSSVPDVYRVFEKRAKEERAIAVDSRVHHKYSDVWTQKELDFVFGDETHLLLHTWRPTLYGLGVGAYPDPVFFKSLVHLANGIAKRQGKVLQGHRILEVSNITGWCDADMLGRPDAPHACRCPFNPAPFFTMAVDGVSNETRASYHSEFPGWAARAVNEKALSVAMADIGYPDVYFIDTPGTAPMYTKLTALRMVVSPSMTYAVTLKFTGLCAVPFTLEKKTALRVVIRTLLGPVLNIFYTRVRKVIETAGVDGGDDTAEVTMVVGMNMGHGYLHRSIYEGFDHMTERASQPGGRSQLEQEFDKIGLVMTAIAVLKIDVLDGNPPETYEDWWRFYAKQLRKSEEAANTRKLLTGLVATVLAIGGLTIPLGLMRKQKRPPARSTSLLRDRLTSMSSKPWSLSSSPESSLGDSEIIPEEDLEMVLDEDGESWKALGHGTSGTVYLGLYKKVHEVAIKVLKRAAGAAVDDSLWGEVELLRSCRHSHVVQFQGVSLVKGDVWLVMEYMAGGDLFVALTNRMDFRWYDRGGQIALDIACGMAYLHSRSIIHLDIKTPNVLLSSDGRAKLGDVGLARLMTAIQTHASMLAPVGTFEYIAPEVLMSGRASHSSDVFSFGVILWEIVTGGRPRRGCLRSPRVPEECSEEIACLLESCLQYDSDQRPSAPDIVSQLRTHLATMQPDVSFGSEDFTTLLASHASWLSPRKDLADCPQSSSKKIDGSPGFSTEDGIQIPSPFEGLPGPFAS